MTFWKRARKRWWDIEKRLVPVGTMAVIVEIVPWPRRVWIWAGKDMQRKPLGWIKALSLMAGGILWLLKHLQLF